MNPVWHAFGVWQTLQPRPPQPFSHPHDEEDAGRFPPETVLRDEPWKIVPPHEGCEQSDPPNPGGQAQDEPLTMPKLSHDCAEVTLAISRVKKDDQS